MRALLDQEDEEGEAVNEALDKAIKQANLNGHHLGSNHIGNVRQWSCIACPLSVVVTASGIVRGWAQSNRCVPLDD